VTQEVKFGLETQEMEVEVMKFEVSAEQSPKRKLTCLKGSRFDYDKWRCKGKLNALANGKIRETVGVVLHILP